MSVRRVNRRDPKTGAVRQFWMVDVDFEHVDGHRERVRKVSPVQSFRGAERYEREVRAALSAPVVDKEKEVPRVVPRLSEFVPEFLVTYAQVNNKFSEVETKRSTCKCHLVPFFGAMRLDAIGARDIERFKAKMIGEGYAPKSVNNALTVLRKMLSVAVDWDHLDHVPAVKWLRVPPQRFDFLDFDEAQRLVAGADARWRPMIVTALKTGLRLGELMALRWEDVDLIAGRLVVRQNLSRGRLTTPKNGRERQVPLSDDLVTCLKAHRHRRGELLFCHDDGSCLRRGETKHPLWRACARAGLRRIGWHSLRHTFASHLVMRGAPMKAVQELLGHQSFEMTMRYAHLSPDVRKDAVRLLDVPFYGNLTATQTPSDRNVAN
jgi:integrase